MLDPRTVLINEFDNERKLEKQYHIHPQDFDAKEFQFGASSSGKCIFENAWTLSGLPRPKKSGLKADTGFMDTGTIWHSIIGAYLDRYYNSAGFRKDNPNLHYGLEIYIPKFILKLGEYKVNIVSPLDICFCDQEFEIREIEFKNQKIKTLCIPNTATVLKAYDIKAVGDYMYYKVLKETDVGFHYKAQMHVYMAATGLEKMDVWFVNKNNFKQSFYSPVTFDKQFWLELQDRFLKIIKYAYELKKGEINLNQEDLLFMTHKDTFECLYCFLSETHEEEDYKGKLKLKLDRPCEYAAKFIKHQALQKFTVGSKWIRGRSHITIQKIDNEIIISINKSGTVYTDTIYTAFKLFEPR